MNDTPLLIVGAGPTGLALALFLAKCGVTPRIVEKNSGPGQTSRAMVVQARTLEFYRQLGFAEEAVKRGIKMDKLHLREGSREVATFEFSDFGESISPYPFFLSFSQDDHERLLGEQLRAVGIEVEWNTELADFTDDGDRVHATLRKNGREEGYAVAYLCGCDGAHSVVRPGMGLSFPGGTYEQVFYVADVEAEGEAADVHGFVMSLADQDFTAMFPVRSTGTLRLIGVVPAELEGRESVTFEAVCPHVERLIEIGVRKVHWFSTYHVHHRVADHFRRGRGGVFIAGDAGHIHSPAGGQGMNTGIGDAVNLSWKLAAVLRGGADASLLDTYETERITFARSLVATTDKLFLAMAGRNVGSQLFRTLLLPHLMPFAFGFSTVRREAFRMISQTRINYRESALSRGSAGEIHGGDRLPWVEGEEGDNLESLNSFDWQIHVYGAVSEPLRSFAASRNLPIRAFAWSETARAAGLAEDAGYLVRPDGYVSFVSSEQDAAELGRFLESIHAGRSITRSSAALDAASDAPPDGKSV